MKKLLISIAIICSLLSGVSFLNYFSNENAINNSRENVLRFWDLHSHMWHPTTKETWHMKKGITGRLL